MEIVDNIDTIRDTAREFHQYRLSTPRSGKGFPIKIESLTFAFAQDGVLVESNGRLWEFVTTVVTPLGTIAVCTYTHPLFGDFVITEVFRPAAISEQTVEEILHSVIYYVKQQVAVRTGEFPKASG